MHVASTSVGVDCMPTRNASVKEDANSGKLTTYGAALFVVSGVR